MYQRRLHCIFNLLCSWVQTKSEMKMHYIQTEYNPQAEMQKYWEKKKIIDLIKYSN